MIGWKHEYISTTGWWLWYLQYICAGDSTFCHRIDRLRNHWFGKCIYRMEWTLACDPSLCKTDHNLELLLVTWFNTLRPRQNGRHFADDVLKCIFLSENVWISLKISLKFVPKGPINNIPPLVQIMAWRRQGDKPLSEPMMASLLTHICVTWLQWVNLD